jgi:hypothetical protein
MKEHSRVEFVALTGTTPDRLAIAGFGRAGTGKSRFSLTMPGKVGVIPLDRKTRRTLERAADEMGVSKGKIVMPKQDFVRLESPMKLAMMSNDAAMAFYREHVNKVKDAIWTLAEKADVDSIVIDTGTQLSEDVLFANYGRDQKIMPRDRGTYNSEMKQLLASLQHKHIFITHEAKSIWKNEKPTDKDEWTGWSKLEYNTNVILEFTGPPKTDKEKYRFGCTVRLCQDRPDLIGETILTDEDISFEMLATTIYPDGEWA